jgi:N-acetylmuramoyl-L-alanine amidase
MSTRAARFAIAIPVLFGAACLPGPVPSPGPNTGLPAPIPPSTGRPETPPVVVGPETTGSGRVGVPPIPTVVGPIALRVVYPPAGSQIASRDSNFIFGSVGSGTATLRINGRTVDVKPNGSFLAYLPVPTTVDAAAAVYEIEVAQGSDTVRAQHRVTLPTEPLTIPTAGPLIVDSTTLSPRSRLVLERWEPVRVSLRVASAAQAELQLPDGARLPMVAAPSTAVGSRGTVVVATEVPAVRLNSGAWVQVVRGQDSVRLPLMRIALADSAGPRYARLGAAPSTVPDTDRVIIGRPVAGGTYKWFLIPGTVAEVTGRSGTATRIRLDGSLQVYVDSTELAPLPPGSPAPRRVAGNARVVSSGGWSDVRIPMSDIPPYSVDAEPQALILTLHGTTANTDIINLASSDSIVRRVTWRQVLNDRAEYRVELHGAPFGYLVMWDRNALVLRVRATPAIDNSRPLRGLVIAVDAGHPPAGSTGPTGLYEPVATLGIAERLKVYLEQRGASVMMTRSAPGAVALADRPVIARRANAHAFVSIHLNAFPDGVNPFERNGTGTYYFNSWSEPLARAVQAGMVRRMGLRDLGVYYDNLAVLRPTWMPSVLCEGAFLIIPEQEAALRTPEFQDAYARGVAEGLEEYFRGLR